MLWLIMGALNAGAAMGGTVYIASNFNRMYEWSVDGYYTVLTRNHKNFTFDKTNTFHMIMLYRYIKLNTGDKYDKYIIYKDINNESYYYPPGVYEVYDEKHKTTVYIRIDVNTISYYIDNVKYQLEKIDNFLHNMANIIMKDCYCMATMKYGDWDYNVIKEYNKENMSDKRWPQQQKVLNKINEFFNSEQYNKGYFIYGPTKMGKTSLARYAARMYHKTYYRLDLTQFSYNLLTSNLMSKINKNSIVFIDEYDKLDSKTKTSLNADLHRWLQSYDVLKEKVLFIIASNSELVEINGVLKEGRIEAIEFKDPNAKPKPKPIITPKPKSKPVLIKYKYKNLILVLLCIYLLISVLYTRYV